MGYGLSLKKLNRMIEHKDIIKKLKSLSNPKAIIGMAKYGIIPENTYGVSIPNVCFFPGRLLYL